MLRFSIGVLSVLVCVAPAHAETARAPSDPAAPASVAAAAAGDDDNAEPTVVDRRIVAIASASVAVLALAGGVTFGLLAQQDLACLKNVVACNATRADRIVGLELFDRKAELEQKAVFADMFFVSALSAAIVATVSGLQGFVFVEEPAPPAPPAQPPPAPPDAGAEPSPALPADPPAEPPAEAAAPAETAPANSPAADAPPTAPAPAAATDGNTPAESAP